VVEVGYIEGSGLDNTSQGLESSISSLGTFDEIHSGRADTTASHCFVKLVYTGETRDQVSAKPIDGRRVFRNLCKEVVLMGFLEGRGAGVNTVVRDRGGI
jgi:hypothetical protein